jgi:microcystin-dependent protein
MALTPADTLLTIAAQTETNTDLPVEEFPGMRSIQRTDLVGPVATNKPHAGAEKRLLSLREKVNNLTEIVNQMDTWYPRMYPAVQKNGLTGFHGNLPMNGHPITGLPVDNIAPNANGDRLASRAQLRSYAIAVSTVAPGSIWMHGGNAVPTGWLYCNGADYDPNDPTYSALFGAIGFAYGSSGGRFRVPNFSGRFPVGANGGYNPGDMAGENAHTLSGDELPPHAHSILSPYFFTNGGGGVMVDVYGQGSGNTGNAGSGWAHENRPPFAAVTIIIKL